MDDTRSELINKPETNANLLGLWKKCQERVSIP